MNKSLTGGMKLAAKQLLEDGQMCDIRYGTVVSASPLKVQITNLLTLPESVLVVPEHLTDHTMEIELDGITRVIKMLNALKVGDKVALLRKTGGQSYFILDRV